MHFLSSLSNKKKWNFELKDLCSPFFFIAFFFSSCNYQCQWYYLIQRKEEVNLRKEKKSNNLDDTKSLFKKQIKTQKRKHEGKGSRKRQRSCRKKKHFSEFELGEGESMDSSVQNLSESNDSFKILCQIQISRF